MVIIRLSNSTTCTMNYVVVVTNLSCMCYQITYSKIYRCFLLNLKIVENTLIKAREFRKAYRSKTIPSRYILPAVLSDCIKHCSLPFISRSSAFVACKSNSIASSFNLIADNSRVTVSVARHLGNQQQKYVL